MTAPVDVAVEVRFAKFAAEILCQRLDPEHDPSVRYDAKDCTLETKVLVAQAMHALARVGVADAGEPIDDDPFDWPIGEAWTTDEDGEPF